MSCPVAMAQPSSQHLHITIPRARNLPRTLLRAPSPYIELHHQPAAPPAYVSTSADRTTAPEWTDFSHTLTIPIGAPATFGLIIRDSNTPHPPLGRLTITLTASALAGWFPLLADGPQPTLAEPHPAAEVYILATRGCTPSHHPLSDFPLVPTSPPSSAANEELRRVASASGALFRSGALRIAVQAYSVPATVKTPFLRIAAPDQAVWGHERTADQVASVITVSKAVKETGKGVMRLAARNTIKPLRAEGTLQDVAALLKQVRGISNQGRRQIKKRWSKQKRGEDDMTDKATTEVEVDDETVREENASGESFASSGELRVEDEKKGEESDSQVSDDLEEHVAKDNGNDSEENAVETNEAEGDTDGCSSVQATPQSTPDVKANARRTVDFGTFELALFPGSFPKSLKLTLLTKAAPFTATLATLTEQKVQLPEFSSLVCSCKESCSPQVVYLQSSDGSVLGSRITLRLTLQMELWAPIGRCREVTQHFQEVLGDIDEVSKSLKERFTQAEELTYLFVGGLFTQHYPMYFEKNIAYLQETVRVARVQTIPIHTEGSLARNSRIIRDCVVRTCRGARSVVLIGHSKGGVDALTVVERYPEVVPFLYGIVAFQAPFGGSVLVDYVSRSSLAKNAIEGLIENVWKGDGAAFTDIGYASRLRAMGLSDVENGVNMNEEEGNETAEKQSDAEARERRESDEKASSMDESFGSSADSAENSWRSLGKVPVVAFSSYASFDILDIRSAANAAGVASMAPAAQKITQMTGFANDGLVTPYDALVPEADVVVLDDMMHTEPALYVQGTRYHPGKLTAAALVLLFELADLRGVKRAASKASSELNRDTLN